MNAVTTGATIRSNDLDQVINWLIGVITSDNTVTVVAPGDIKLSAVASPPAGWLLCDGSAVSRSTYANLFAAIGTTYGSGDGTSTFNVPDLRGRVPVGAGTGPGLSTRYRGNTGGEEAHSLTAAENGAHSHSAVTGTQSALHTHGWSNTAASGYGGGVAYITTASAYAQGTVSVTTGNESTYHAHGIPSDGSGSAHNVMQPFLVINAFIKV